MRDIEMTKMLDDIMNEALDDAIDKVVVENETNMDKFVRVYSFVVYEVGRNVPETEKSIELFRQNCDRIFERFMSLLPFETDWRRERFDVPGYKLVDGYLIRKQRSIENVTKLLSMIALAYRYHKDSYGRQIGISVATEKLSSEIINNVLFPHNGREYVKVEHRVRYQPIELNNMFYHAYSALCLKLLTEEDVRNELLTHEYISCITYSDLHTVSPLALTFSLECTGTMFMVQSSDIGKKYSSVDGIQRIIGSYYGLPVVLDKAVLTVSKDFDIVFCGRFFLKDAYHFISLNDYIIATQEKETVNIRRDFQSFGRYLNKFQQQLKEMGVILTDDLISEIRCLFDPKLNIDYLR